MSDKPSTPATENAAAGASSSASTSSAAGGSSSTAAPKSQGNPAFRMMGLPRLRLPSRNWLIFLSITGGFASAVIYDKYQTRRTKEKWCNLVSHIAQEHISTHTMPRKLTIYMAAPPGDSLRSSREHFHNYMKPILVSAAMDWDVVEGRKEGDVRHKTAERIRKKRKRAGEGEKVAEDEEDQALTVDGIREKNGTLQWDGVAGDIVVGRNTWKEYMRGLHEGWLGPADAPKQPDSEVAPETTSGNHTPGQSSLGDAAVKATADAMVSTSTDSTPGEGRSQDAMQPSNDQQTEEKPKEEEKKKEEEEPPKPRQPPPYIQPSEYESATLSRNIPDLIGPTSAVRLPHILGFRNTPIRIYRFLTRRHLADSVGRDVAAAVLASYRPYNSNEFTDENSASSDLRSTPEQVNVLKREERDWWKTTFQPRKEHEESVWIEDVAVDERITSRMRAFQLTAEDEDRAKRLFAGTEKVVKKDVDADGS